MRPAEELERVYRDQAAKLWRSLLVATGDRDIASDAVSEAFAQALARGDEIRSPERWVWRAAYRIALGELKRRTLTPNPGSDRLGEEMSSSMLELLDGLSSLTPNQRAAIVLHYYAGYHAREIADLLGMSGATVRVHLSKGRQRLRRALEADDD